MWNVISRGLHEYAGPRRSAAAAGCMWVYQKKPARKKGGAAVHNHTENDRPPTSDPIPPPWRVEAVTTATATTATCGIPRLPRFSSRASLPGSHAPSARHISRHPLLLTLA